MIDGGRDLQDMVRDRISKRQNFRVGLRCQTHCVSSCYRGGWDWAAIKRLPTPLFSSHDPFVFIERWKQSLKWQRLTPYEKFAAMIERHWEGIASYCHPENKVSLGLVEGLNNKIRVLQRRAYGYRDEEYLKLKIVAAFLPPLTRSAEKDPL